MKKNKKNIYTFLVLMFFFSVAANNVHAQLVPCGLNGAADCTLCHLVIGFKGIYDYLLKLLLAASTMVIVVAGVMYMVSSGDKGMIDKAKSALTYALTAIILALVAWLIINATLHALGYKNVGNWYTFTCDTTQTPPPAQNSSGGATLPASGGSSGSTGTGGAGGKISGTGVVSSGQMTADQFFAQMRESSIYVNRRAGAQTGWINGKYYNDCSGSVQEWAKRGFGYDPGGSTSEMMENAQSYQGVNSLNVGDSLVANGSAGPTGHALIYIGNGMVMGNSGVGKNVRISPITNYTVAGVIKTPKAN
jgi:cell wall-associated NlpC family hydrolase